MRVRTYKSNQKLKYVEEYRKSGKSVSEFAKDKNIPESTLRTWLRKESEAEIVPKSDVEPEVENFGEVKIEDIRHSLILVTDKIKIELQEGYNKQFLQKFMEVIL